MGDETTGAMSTLPVQDNSRLGAMKLALRSLVPQGGLFPQSEHRCIDRAVNGDRRSFDELVVRYEGELRAFVKRKVSESEVDDILQDTWIAAWTALRGFDRRSRFKTWLIGIALNKCRDHYRQRPTAPDASLGEDRADAAYHESSFANAELGIAIKNALAELSEAQREVLELYYFSGLNLTEIAQILDRNLNTVKYQFYRAHSDTATRLKVGASEEDYVQ